MSGLSGMVNMAVKQGVNTGIANGYLNSDGSIRRNPDGSLPALSGPARVSRKPEAPPSPPQPQPQHTLQPFTGMEDSTTPSPSSRDPILLNNPSTQTEASVTYAILLPTLPTNTLKASETSNTPLARVNSRVKPTSSFNLSNSKPTAVILNRYVPPSANILKPSPHKNATSDSTTGSTTPIVLGCLTSSMLIILFVYFIRRHISERLLQKKKLSYEIEAQDVPAPNPSEYHIPSAYRYQSNDLGIKVKRFLPTNSIQTVEPASFISSFENIASKFSNSISSAASRLSVFTDFSIYTEDSDGSSESGSEARSSFSEYSESEVDMRVEDSIRMSEASRSNVDFPVDETEISNLPRKVSFI